MQPARQTGSDTQDEVRSHPGVYNHLQANGLNRADLGGLAPPGLED